MADKNPKLRYEYIRIPIDMGDLTELNRYSQDGWRLVQIVEMNMNAAIHYAVLERMT